MRNSERQFPIPLLLVGVGFIIVGIAIYILISGATPAPASSSVIIPTFLPDYPESQFPRVSLADALAAYTAKSAIFVDVRGKDAYDLHHIPGALSIPLADIANNLAKLPKNDWIIPYCT